MKAAVFSRYGDNDVVTIAVDATMPVPGPRDVLIAVRAASVNPVDWKVRSGEIKFITGSRFPKVLGCECAGEIAGIGSGVTRFKPGDQVIAWPGARRLGAFAQLAAVAEASVCAKSPQLTFEQACCLPIAGLTALQALRDKGQIAYGKKVLINGASGGVGHFAVQIAKIFGAEATAVCSSGNADFVRGLGADRVIDYRNQDFTKGDVRYDIVFDAVANRSFREVKPVLSRHGRYVSTLPSAGVIFNQFVSGFFTNRKAAIIMVKPAVVDMVWMQEQITAGRIRVVIDRRYPLDLAKDALAYSETGRARGKIVLHVDARA
jgi:NADPH:quinone reductase-like Zn-dependent oxidoreductase